VLLKYRRGSDNSKIIKHTDGTNYLNTEIQRFMNSLLSIKVESKEENLGKILNKFFQ
jgi:hypothetical protein